MTTKTQEMIKDVNYKANIAFALLAIAFLLAFIAYKLAVKG